MTRVKDRIKKADVVFLPTVPLEHTPPNVGEARTSLNTFYQHLLYEDPKVAGRGIRTLIRVHDNIKIDSSFLQMTSSTFMVTCLRLEWNGRSGG